MVNIKKQYSVLCWQFKCHIWSNSALNKVDTQDYSINNNNIIKPVLDTNLR